MTPRLLALVAVLWAVGLLAPAGAGAHAAFLGSSPGPGQRVEAAPGQLVLRFTEPLNARLTTVRLEGPRGRLPASVAIAGSALTVTPAGELGDGGWVARWRTVSTEDGHPLEGRFSFGVRADPFGARSWLRGERDASWQRSERAVPFGLRTWFRWTPFAQGVWLLDTTRKGDRRVAQIAFFDPGTPSWQRLQIDLRSGRALRGEIVARAHYITQRFDRYQRPVRISAPRDVRG